MCHETVRLLLSTLTWHHVAKLILIDKRFNVEPRRFWLKLAKQPTWNLISIDPSTSCWHLKKIPSENEANLSWSSRETWMFDRRMFGRVHKWRKEKKRRKLIKSFPSACHHRRIAATWIFIISNDMEISNNLFALALALPLMISLLRSSSSRYLYL